MMHIEKARRIANKKLDTLIKPLINEGEEFDPTEFIEQANLVKAEIKEETGYEVDQFFVNPIGFGLFEITTTFTTGEKRHTGPVFYQN